MRKARHGDPLAFCQARALGEDGIDICVIWPFKRQEGYGRLGVGTTTRPAHQIVLELAGLPCPGEGLEVRHLCGVRPCVNLNHLRWGTRSENQQDRFRRHGDTMRGERNPRAKLSSAEVDEIRGRLASGSRVADEARRYGVSSGTIYFIKSGQTWVAA